VNEKKQILDQEKAVLDEYTAKFDREKNKLHEMHESIRESEKTVADNAEKKTQLENSIPEMEEAVRERKVEVENMKNERPNIQTKIEQLSSKLADAQQEEGGGRSRGKVLDYVKKKIVPGVVGRLGDLGGIDQRYDVALSSSCDMDYIVVERVADATKILEYVKRDKVGAVRFFALDKVRPFASADQFKLPGPRLVDQIRCDREDLMGCFFQACGNTLVARNSEEAEHFAFNCGGRHRAVSLDGVLVESSGAMTGGGGRKQSGAMGEKPQINVRKETVSEDEINEMNTALNDLRQELRDLDSKIREANGFIARTTKEIAKNKVNEILTRIFLKLNLSWSFNSLVRLMIPR
jgi:structural maintenance of chromosome 4